MNRLFWRTDMTTLASKNLLDRIIEIIDTFPGTVSCTPSRGFEEGHYVLTTHLDNGPITVHMRATELGHYDNSGMNPSKYSLDIPELGVHREGVGGSPGGNVLATAYDQIKFRFKHQSVRHGA